MKSMFTSDSRFNPQGAQPVALAGSAPQGWNAQLPVAQQPGGMPIQPQGGGMPMQAGAVPQVNGGGMQVPQGAQPVALAGSNDPTAQQQPTMPPAQAQPFFNRPPQPQAQPQAQPQLGSPGGDQVHTISVQALGGDGREYLAEFDAVFPAGSRILGVTERRT